MPPFQIESPGVQMRQVKPTTTLGRWLLVVMDTGQFPLLARQGRSRVGDYKGM